MIVLDTNVVSEFMRPQPDASVLAWLDNIPRSEIWTTSITVAEVSAGIAVLPAGHRRTRLEKGFTQALRGFEDRILGFTTVAALRYGSVISTRARLGHPISIADAQITAITLESGGTLATRNAKDFDGTELIVIDPWDTGTS